jgi:hypothetical protein
MHRTRRRRHLGLWLIGAGGLLSGARADEADIADVRRIMGGDELPQQQPSQDQEHIRKLLDNVARAETQRLGGTDWSAANPHWEAVYHQVRSDLESEQPTIAASLREAARASTDRFVAATAAALSPQDAKAILAYYDTAEGQRYEQFMRRVDVVMVWQGAASMPREASPQPQAISEQQRSDYSDMLMLSRTFQAELAFTSAARVAHQDTSGSAAFALLVAWAIRLHQPEVAAIFSEYRDDLPAFSSFEKTPASQSLFRAMGQAMQLTPQWSKPIHDALESMSGRHRDVWKAAYAAETRSAGKQ